MVNKLFWQRADYYNFNFDFNKHLQSSKPKNTGYE